MRRIFFIDLFCGAGGVTSGITRARYMGERIAEVIACVNHDPLAIASHEYNHPDCLHYIEKIQVLDLTELRLLVNRLRREQPDCLIFIWGSLECTNFSKAKGGLPRDADSRTLAEHMFRYLEELLPDGLWIENVEEFMCWGPLDENGKPISARNGEDYLRWVNQVQNYGYNFDYRILNSADFGAYTSRKRYFAQFMRPGIPIVWPEPTHSKKVAAGGIFGTLEKWKAVKDVLDFNDEGKSIFGRKKPLSEKTLERIYAGLIKYVAGGKKAFILKYNSTSKTGVHVPPSIDAPSPTISCQNRIGMIQTSFLTKYYSGDPASKVLSINEPASTLRTKDSLSLIQTGFLAKYYSNGGQLNSIEEPAATIPTKDRLSLVQPKYWIDKNYSGSCNHQSVNQPAGTIVTNDKHALIKADSAFLMHTNFNNKPTGLEVPAPTGTANGKWSYLVNPSWYGYSSSIDNPSPVIVARQDKAPMYLLCAESGHLIIKILETDSTCMKQIKQFMSVYGIVDIRMRMLRVPELLRIMGFGDKYHLKGTQADKKRFIGNAVEVNQARVLIESMYLGIMSQKELKTA